MSLRRLVRGSDLTPGRPEVVRLEGERPPRNSVLVVATPEGIRAYWNICRHLPIPLDAGSGALAPGPRLVCRTHGASYEATTGRCVAGPCVGESLEPVPVEIDEAGDVYARI